MFAFAKCGCIIIMFLASTVYAAGQHGVPVAVVEKMHPQLDTVIDINAEISIIASGFEWVEGPLWVESQHMLLFSDVPKNTIYKWTSEKGKEIYLTPSGYTKPEPRGGETGSNGMALDGEGKLVLCQHGDRRVAIMNAKLNNPAPDFITLAGSYKNKKFNSPNDLAVKTNGDVYFTDPPYGLEKGVKDSVRELSFHGVYRVNKDGVVSLLIDTLTRPNGIAFFPGEKQLLVANSDAKKPHWYIYDLNENGDLENGRIFFNGLANFLKERRGPDGIKIDKRGNVFAPGPVGVWIINKEGVPLGRIKTKLITSNCALSDDENTLFITANHDVLKVTLRSKK